MVPPQLLLLLGCEGSALAELPASPPADSSDWSAAKLQPVADVLPQLFLLQAGEGSALAELPAAPLTDSSARSAANLQTVAVPLLESGVNSLLLLLLPGRGGVL